MKYLTAFFSLLYLGTLIAAEWPLAEIKIRTADPANPIQKLAGRELEKHLHLIALQPTKRSETITQSTSSWGFRVNLLEEVGAAL